MYSSIIHAVPPWSLLHFLLLPILLRAQSLVGTRICCCLVVQLFNSICIVIVNLSLLLSNRAYNAKISYHNMHRTIPYTYNIHISTHMVVWCCTTTNQLHINNTTTYRVHSTSIQHLQLLCCIGHHNNWNNQFCSPLLTCHEQQQTHIGTRSYDLYNVHHFSSTYHCGWWSQCKKSNMGHDAFTTTQQYHRQIIIHVPCIRCCRYLATAQHHTSTWWT